MTIFWEISSSAEVGLPMQVTVDVSSDEILALGTAPKVIIPAAPAWWMNVIQFGIFEFRPSSIPYSDDGWTVILKGTWGAQTAYYFSLSLDWLASPTCTICTIPSIIYSDWTPQWDISWVNQANDYAGWNGVARITLWYYQVPNYNYTA